jgi:diaminopimelate epimerase
MGALAFEKYEGLGNDFVVVDVPSRPDAAAEWAVRLCDRRRGIGADGVLFVSPSASARDGRMVVMNADGSVPEMCGNGLRCVALHVARRRGLRGGELIFETDAGLRRCEIEDGAGEGIVTIDMGEIALLGRRELDLDGESLVVELADAGNPHAIRLGPFTRGDVERLGPKIATHVAFPSGTNAEFAVAGRGGIDLVVWERGVGVTEACGTGACATAAVACHLGLAAYGEPVDVRLPGGALSITIDRATGRAAMRGPARHVFSGTFPSGDAAPRVAP